jgi:hypothetical protein
MSGGLVEYLTHLFCSLSFRGYGIAVADKSVLRILGFLRAQHHRPRA